MTVSEHRSLEVPEGLDGERMDAGLARLLGMSRSRVVELLSLSAVNVEGSPAGKSDRLVAGQWLEIELPDPPSVVDFEVVATPVADFAVLYADDDIMVIDKPVGVAAHPSPGWTGPTVIGALAAAGFRVSTSGAQERQGIVHRLDVGTSGVMAVAASERAYSSLKRQFKERTVDKRYHAVVQGHPDPSSGTIDAPIDRHPSADYKFAVVNDGRPSITHYDTLEAFPSASLLDVHLETGRTHQIRVHMAALRHPCCGDITYGADPTLAARLKLGRQWLHAVRLEFEHPGTGARVSFESDYPADLTHALNVLRRAA
jgi:23S rRNA pseudouridine1911/1915/1917 synthase